MVRLVLQDHQVLGVHRVVRELLVLQDHQVSREISEHRALRGPSALGVQLEPVVLVVLKGSKDHKDHPDSQAGLVLLATRDLLVLQVTEVTRANRVYLVLQDLLVL